MTPKLIIGRLLREHIAPYKSKIAIAIVFMLLSGGMTALFATLVEPVIDNVLHSGTRATVVPIILGVLVSFVLRGVGSYISSVQMIEVGQGIVADVQARLFNTILGQDLAYFHANVSGALQSRVINDVNIVRVAVVDTMLGLGLSTLTVIGLAGVMVYQDWRLALISCFVVPIIVFAMSRIGRRLRKVSRYTQDAQADLAGHLMQVFQGVRQVKSFNAEGREAERTGVKFRTLRDLNIKATRLSNLNAPINDTLAGLAMVGLLSYGAWAVGQGTLTAGELMSFITAFLMAYEPIKKLAKLNATLQVGIGASERIFAMIDQQAEILEPENPVTLPPAPYSIAFNNVTFQYKDSEKAALHNLSLVIKSGETVALVGPSGGGKSTILNLIPRFYDPDNGDVLINDINVRNLDVHGWRAQVALVSQDIVLFNDTVAANIAYAKPNATEAEIEAAAHAANAHQFISAMPQGYDTQMGENGVRLSGGQRQRIALARAILKDAPVLLLDEATSALDTESEILIQRALEEFSQSRTVVMIAHRLSTIQNADRIIVIKDGRIVEEGTHDGLMEAGGLYGQLYRGDRID